MKKFPKFCNYESFFQSKALSFLGDLAMLVVRKSEIPAMAWPGEYWL